MLLTLMYHRVGIGPRIDKHANSRAMLEEHFLLLKERYPILLPGDPIPSFKLAACLTFDDATFDFYHYIFPIIKKLQMRVLLGVPVHYIVDSTKLDAEERLSVPYTLMMQDGFYENKVPFCTWEELDEMVSSGWVEIASHSYKHCNLTFNFVDLDKEIVQSKEIIEKKLAQPISSFIYPFGKTSVALHEYVKEHYLYAFRIGSALNFGWGNSSRPLNRVSADNLTHINAPFSFFNLAKAFGKTLLN